MAYNTPTIASVGDILSAAYLNAYVRDNWRALGDPWTPYTPTWSGTPGQSPAIGNGTLQGSYVKIGRLCIFRMHMKGGTTTNAGGGSNAYRFTMPFNAATGQATFNQNGSATLVQSIWYDVGAMLDAPGSNGFVVTLKTISGTRVALSFMTAGGPEVFGNGHVLNIGPVIYETAS